MAKHRRSRTIRTAQLLAWASLLRRACEISADTRILPCHSGTFYRALLHEFNLFLCRTHPLLRWRKMMSAELHRHKNVVGMWGRGCCASNVAGVIVTRQQPQAALCNLHNLSILRGAPAIRCIFCGELMGRHAAPRHFQRPHMEPNHGRAFVGLTMPLAS